MKKCGVYACPNEGVWFYMIDTATKVWLCEDCVARAEKAVSLDRERELAAVG